MPIVLHIVDRVLVLKMHFNFGTLVSYVRYGYSLV